MDIIKQNKFIGLVVAILIALNILTLSIIWIQSNRNNPLPLIKEITPSAGQVKLMQSEIGLSDEQAKQYQKIRSENQGIAKPINDELDRLKLRIAEEIFNPAPNEKKVDSIAAQIGVLQSKVEVLRFKYFRQLVQICDAGQRSKLQPIIKEVFEKKPPQGKPEIVPPQKKNNDTAKVRIENKEERPPRNDGRPAPPSREEKLKKYANRLSLTSDQIKKVEVIMSDNWNKGEKLKAKLKPGEFEQEKEALRKEEDANIMKVLGKDQKQEFKKMIRNRGKK